MKVAILQANMPNEQTDTAIAYYEQMIDGLKEFIDLLFFL